MAEIDIIQKIKNKLSAGSYQESDVVYILVEMYKLLEQKNKKKEFQLIVFYRNWACHFCLDSERNSDVKLFFDKIIGVIKKNNLGIDSNEITDHLTETIFLFYFGKLKEEMDKFLDDYLDSIQVDWETFKMKLYNVLVNQPLKVIVKMNGVERVLSFEYTPKPMPLSVLDDSLEVSIRVDNRVIISHSTNETYIKYS